MQIHDLCNQIENLTESKKFLGYFAVATYMLFLDTSLGILFRIYIVLYSFKLFQIRYVEKM